MRFSGVFDRDLNFERKALSSIDRMETIKIKFPLKPMQKNTIKTFTKYSLFPIKQNKLSVN